MDKEGQEIIVSGGSSSNVQQNLHNLVKKFLDKEDFEKGSHMTNQEINLALNEFVGRTVNIDEEYKAFLNEYGSIDGAGYEIYGPTQYHMDDSDEKIQYLVSIQCGFKNRCKKKSCWLIAGIDQGDEYYIDFSDTKIYSLSPNGKSKLFAEHFLEFLDKFFEIYERQPEGNQQ